MSICRRCAGTFIAKRVGQVFCTKTCSDRHRAEQAHQPTRVCNRCRIEKPRTEFHSANSGRHINRVIGRCKTCVSATRPKKRDNPTRTTWAAMIQRCTNPSHDSFAYYGAKGIAVCDRWLNSFEDFLADMGERPPGTTIDRIDNTKGYELDNCRWSPQSTQAQNRSSTELNAVAVCLMRHMKRRGVTGSDLGHAFGVSVRHANKVCEGATWSSF